MGGRSTLAVMEAEADANREVGANSEKVKRREDKGSKMKLTPTVDTCKNTACSVLSLFLFIVGFSCMQVSCKIPKKLGHFF